MAPPARLHLLIAQQSKRTVPVEVGVLSANTPFKTTRSRPCNEPPMPWSFTGMQGLADSVGALSCCTHRAGCNVMFSNAEFPFLPACHILETPICYLNTPRQRSAFF